MASDTATETVQAGTLERAGTWAGPAGAVIGLVSVLIAAALTPWFSWTGDALSELGGSDADLAWLFNYGLLASGVLGTVFAIRLTTEVRTAIHAAGVLVLGASTASLAGIGAFPIGTDLHGPFSISFFATLTYGLVLWGSGDVLDGRINAGLAAIWLGMTNATAWFVYAIVAAASETARGVAIPEFVGAVALSAWVIGTAQWLRESRNSTQASDAAEA